MTGFAMVRSETGAGELTASLRSVNHRSLDLHFHLPSELAPVENAVRGVLKQRIRRGHVEIRASLARDGKVQPDTFNRELLERYLKSFRSACAEFSLHATPDLNAFFRLPGAFENGISYPSFDRSMETVVTQAFESCVDELNAFREREGAELYDAMCREIEKIDSYRKEVEGLRGEAAIRFHVTLRERLNEMLNNTTISEARIMEEAALIADRSDIAEELTRLRTHTDELTRYLHTGGEVGKKADFLLQEMNREANTMLSKTAGTGEMGLRITNLGIEIKTAIEKMRELALNLE